MKERAMAQENIPEYIQYLMDADVYPHPVADVLLVQTHISFVVLAGAYVYKWKKPVDLGFLNFSTLSKRRYFCCQELALNRRLCPEVYLDLVSVTRDASGRLHLNGRGTVIEYGVRMIRLSEERMMGRLIAEGLLQKSDLDRIVAKLVPFYKLSEGAEGLMRYGRVREIGRSVLENFEQTERFVGKGVLEATSYKDIRNFSVGFLARQELFEKRMAEGKIRDCHGDLHSDNICLADEIHIFDCIEFSRRLRCLDIAADVAFLAMDLDLHDLRNFSEYFIEQFILASGDVALRPMLDFYKCYRAYVRGKINLLTAIDPTVDAEVAGRCRERAGRYFELAERYTRSPRRMKL
jgi:aminoglycoside phosphotransferase family enzyme